MLGWFLLARVVSGTLNTDEVKSTNIWTMIVELTAKTHVYFLAMIDVDVHLEVQKISNFIDAGQKNVSEHITEETS